MTKPAIYTDSTIARVTGPRLEQMICVSFLAGNSPMIWGPPGIGKTSLVRDLESENFTSLWQRVSGTNESFAFWPKLPPLSAVGPVDLNGIPFPREVKTERDVIQLMQMWARSSLLPSQPHPEGKRWIVFFDEINSAGQIMQPPLYQLIQEGRIGEFALPPGTVRIAAGNRQADKAVVTPMSTALRGRLVHFELQVQSDAWIQVAHKIGVLPQIIAYIRSQPDSLLRPDPAATATPSPRTWELASNQLKALIQLLQATGHTTENIFAEAAESYEKKEDTQLLTLMLTALASCVGTAEAAAAVGYFRVFGQIPSIREIRAKPTTAKVPTNKGAQLAVATLCAASISDNVQHDQQTENVLVYLSRLPNELASMTYNDLCLRQKDLLKKSAAFRKWVLEDNKHMFSVM